MFEVPKITASKHGNAPIITFDVVDDAGNLLRTRNPTVSEVFKLLQRESIVAAFNARAEFELWKNRQAVSQLWGPYRSGIWRGRPNPHAVK